MTIEYSDRSDPLTDWEELRCDDCGTLTHDMSLEQKKWYFFCVAGIAFTPNQAKGLGEFFVSTYNKRISDNPATLFAFFHEYGFVEGDIRQLVIFTRILRKIFNMFDENLAEGEYESNRILQYYLSVFGNNSTLEQAKVNCLVRLARDVYNDRLFIYKLGKKGQEPVALQRAIL